MRRALALLVLLTIPLLVFVAWRGGEPQVAGAARAQDSTSAFTGTVVETVNGGGYTYAKLEAPGREVVWIAASEFATKPGDRVTATLETPMADFESKTLNRTFPLIYFVSTVTQDGTAGGDRAAAPAMPQMMTSRHSASAQTAGVKVEPNEPPDGGLSIAQVWMQRKALAGREVTVRGTVVKANNGILNTNWVHLQDGSGSAADGTNDLTLTTDALVRVGDVITARGLVAVNKEIGEGYRYDVILEQARVEK